MEKIKRSVAMLLAVIMLSGMIIEMNFALAADTIVAEGNYILKNVATNECITLENNSDKDNAKFILKKRKNQDVSQVIKIKKKGKAYGLQPAESTTRFMRISASAKSGSRTYLGSSSSGSTQKWIFSVTINGEYVIRSASNNSLVLTASDGKLTVKRYSEGSSAQRWKLVPFKIKKSGERDGVYEYGVDVSNHNGDINWQAVKEYGISFAIIRVGFGMDQEDQDDLRFKANADACRELGIPFGVYIYSYANTVEKAKSEAYHCLRLVSGYDLNFPIYYDLEDEKTTGKCSNSKILKISKAFAKVISDAGYEVGFYASTNWWQERLTDSYYDKHSRWVAQYNDECTYEGVKDMWQYTSAGKIPGMPGDADMDALYYSLSGEVSEVMYTGEEITPELNVKGPNGKLLEKDTDYTVTWRDNVDVGTAYADIVGIKSYKGFKRTEKFKITQRQIISAEFTEIKNRSYTGKAITPKVKATYNGKKLVEGVDYTVKYENNRKVGTATITVTGIGNFKGKKIINFDIKKLNVKNAVIKGLKDKAYTGKKRGSLSLYTKEGVELTRDKDYTLTFKNNREIGKATVTIKGIGSRCTGTRTVSFKIIPNAPENLRTVKRTLSTVKLRWDKSDEGTYYRLYRSKDPNGEYDLIYAGEDNYFYDTGLDTATFYFYKVKATKKVNGVRYYSEASDILKCHTKLNNTDFTLSKNTSERTIKVKMEKRSSATGYAVYRYKSAESKFVRVYRGTSNEYTVTNLQKGYKYKIAVRTYKDTEYGRIYSAMSDEKSIRI